MKNIAAIGLACWLAIPASGSVVVEDAAAAFDVHVVDRNDGPVQGAEVEWIAGEGDAASTAAASATDAEGRAALALEPGTYRVRVSAAGSLDWTSERTPCTAEARCTVTARLFPAAALSGRIADAKANPIAEAEACLTLHHGEAYAADLVPAGTFADGQACATSAADGALGFPPLPQGRYGLRIEAEGFVPHEAVLELDGEATRNWVLAAGGTLAGRLLDLEDRGVAGAEVRLRHRERRQSTETVTDAEGRLRIDGLAPGRWHVALLPADASGLERDGVEIVAGRTTDLGSLRTRPGAEIAGRVRGNDGMPVAGAEVKIHEPAPTLRFLRKATTGDDGTFRIGGLEPDRAYVLVVLPMEGYAAGVVDEVDAPRRDLVVALDAAARVCGTVRAESGAAPRGVRITARSRREGSLAVIDSAVGSSTKEIDPATGEFCLEAPPSDEITVEAFAAGYWSDPVKTSAGPGDTTERLALRMRRGDTLEGSVVDARGEPIVDAALMAPGAPMVHTDRFGEFALGGLRPGMNAVTAQHASYATVQAQIMVAPDADRAVIEMRRGGTVEGSVSHADGRPAEGIAVGVESPALQAVTGTDGRYRVEHVPAGERTLSRRAAGSYDDFERRNVDVVDGETLQVDFTLGVVLEGTVLRGGAAVAGVNISLARPDAWDHDKPGGHAVQQTFSDETGAYRLAGARAGWGTFTLVVADQNVVRVVEIPAGDAPRLDLALPDVPVDGRVVAAADGTGIARSYVSAPLPRPAGAPLAEGSSTYHSREGLGQGILYSISTSPKCSTQSDEDGNFSLLVDPSVRQIDAWAMGYDFKSEAVDPGSPQPVTIELGRRVDVELTLRDASGRPLPRTDVCFIRTTEHGSSRSCTGGNADPVRQSVDEGPATILAGATGFGTQVLEQDLRVPEEGGPVRLSVRLVPGAGLRVRLVGQPAAESKILALVDPAGADRTVLVREAQTDPGTGDRVWRTWPLEPGTWRIDVDPGDGHTLSKQIDIVAGGDQELAFP